MFPKNKLSVAIAVATGSIAMGALQVSQASSVFFPQIVKSAEVTTIVSVINTGTDNNAINGNNGTAYPYGAFNNNLHYRLYYKTTADNSAICNEIDRYLPTSANDIQTFDIGGNLNSSATRGVLFNDPSVNNNWDRGDMAYNNWRMLAGATAARAYLIVDDRNSESTSFTVSGEAFLFDFDSGAAWSYQGFRTGGEDPTGKTTTPGSEFDYSAFRMVNKSPVNLYPTILFNSGFLVTPVNINSTQAGTYSWVAENMVPPTNSMTADLDFNMDDMYGFQAALYNRDEAPGSGSTPQSVTCIGKVAATALVDPQNLGIFEMGGWGSLSSKRVNVKSATNVNGLAPTQPAYSDATGAVVYKIEYNVEGALINNVPIPGVFNTGTLVLPEISAIPYTNPE